jgi:formylglycine-generating enzyme required for sulfatase activity
MSFDLKNWQSEVRAWWAEQIPKLKTTSIDSAYALLAASAWLPLLAAYAANPGTAITALVGITSGVGSNLVANLVQNAYDRTRGGRQVTDQARQDPLIRAELDAILRATQTLEAAQQALGDRWDGFARQLAQEMAALPGESTLTVTLGDGTVVRGSVVTGDLTLDHGSTFVGGDQVSIQAEQVRVSLPPQEDTKASKAQAQERALRAYLERLAGECDVLHLRGMDPRAADATQKETMSLAAVYTALDTTHSIYLDADQVAALKERGEKVLDGIRPTRPMSAVEAASGFDRLVLLGDPGAGKTTFVNYLALHLAQAALHGDGMEALPGWTRGPLVPLRVILRDLARSPCLDENGTAAALWDFVAESLADADLADAAPALRERLESGQAILLFDGLDEVDAKARRPVLDAVVDFARTHRHIPLLVTCRVYAYQEPGWRLPNFEQTTLAPFDERKMDHFVGAWYSEVAEMGLMSTSDAKTRAARLREAVRRPDLRLLAPNPLLLTMMALLHSSYGRLPEDRVRLYSEIVELLLARWEQSRLGRETLTQARLSPGDLRFALEEVAYQAHGSPSSGEGTADVSESLLREILAVNYLEGNWNRAGDVIRYIRERAGLLVERKPGVYAFPHRTLQEYLAGCHLSVQTEFPSLAADLVRRDETRWREPFLVAVGKTARMENRVDLALATVDNLCPRACPEAAEGTVELAAAADERAYRCAWLAGEALVEVGMNKLRQRDAWMVRLERVAGWLAQLLEVGALKPVERAAAGRVLAHLGDPRDLDALVFVPGGPFTMGSGDEDTDARDNERPQHIVEVANFCIGKYPVTNEQYARFIEAGGYDEPRYWTEAGWAWRQTEHKGWGRTHGDRPEWWDDPTWNLPNHPVVGVCWYEALAYTRWLAEVTGRPYRLPTEAEWEKAARGTDGRIYPWGNKWADDYANTGESDIGRTTPVGAFPLDVSPYGALDMGGNVWEWCSTAWANYPYQANDGREHLEGDTGRISRGSSWALGSEYARCGDRSDDYPDYFNSYDGFRVVLPGSVPQGS